MRRVSHGELSAWPYDSNAALCSDNVKADVYCRCGGEILLIFAFDRSSNEISNCFFI